MLILFLVPVAAYGHAAALTPPGKPMSERSVLGAALASYWRWAAGSVVVVFSALIGASASNPTDKTVRDLGELLLSLVLVGVPFVLMGLALRLWMAGDQHREKASRLLVDWAEGDPLRWLWRCAAEAALELSSSLRSSLLGGFLMYFCLAMLVCVPILVVQGPLR